MYIVWNFQSVNKSQLKSIIYLCAFLLGGDEKACRSSERCEHSTLLQVVYDWLQGVFRNNSSSLLPLISLNKLDDMVSKLGPDEGHAVY